MNRYKISDIAIEISNRIDNPFEHGYDKFVGLEHYVSGEMLISNYGETCNLASTVKEFKENDVLIARRNVYLKRAGIALFNGVTSGDSIVLRANSKVMERLLPFILNSDMFWDYADKHSDGSMSKRLSPKMLMDYEFELPDNGELEEYADLLWSLFETKIAYKNQIERSNELVKARFVEMFGSINNNKYGYDVKTIQEVCEPIKDGTHQTPTYTEDSINGFKFLSSKDVVTGKVDWNHLKYIPADLHEQLYARLAPKKGDILLAKNGTTGIAAIVDRDEIFDIYVSLALLRPLETVTSDYLCNAINSFETKTQFNERLKGVGVPNLHLGEIKQTRIVVPPMDKQNEFTTFVREIDKSKFVE